MTCLSLHKVTSYSLELVVLLITKKHPMLSMKRKDQHDATIRCLLLTSVSTCFGHYYAHLQGIKDPVSAFGVLFWFCWMWLVAAVLQDVSTSAHISIKCFFFDCHPVLWPQNKWQLAVSENIIMALELEVILTVTNYVVLITVHWND